MEISPEFQQMVRAFYPGNWDAFEEAILWAANGGSPEGKRKLASFLGSILTANYSDAELQKLWMSCGPTMGLADESVRVLLSEVRNAIDFTDEWLKRVKQ